MDDSRDRLIDILLREELGGEQPPDLSARILARAFPQRFHFGRRAYLAAAGILLAVGMLTWWLWPGYPEPRASGGFEIVGGGKVQRGATLRTKDQSATLELGGYSKLDIKPGSTLRIEGEKFAERVAMETGEVQCRVERGKGAFAVGAPFGNVAVTGTEFGVRVGEEKVGPQLQPSVIVRVATGSVQLTGDWGNSRLTAGEETLFLMGRERKPEARGGTLLGTVVAKVENFLDVKADGEERPRRYVPRWLPAREGQPAGLDRALMQLIARTQVGTRVKVEWTFDERPRLQRLEVLNDG